MSYVALAALFAVLSVIFYLLPVFSKDSSSRLISFFVGTIFFAMALAVARFIGFGHIGDIHLLYQDAIYKVVGTATDITDSMKVIFVRDRKDPSKLLVIRSEKSFPIGAFVEVVGVPGCKSQNKGVLCKELRQAFPAPAAKKE